MKTLLFKLLVASLAVLMSVVATPAQSDEAFDYLGISYTVPDGLLSARKLLADEETTESRKAQLRGLIAQQAAQFEGVVDSLFVSAEADEKGGMTLALDPVEPEDVSHAEYMDGVFSSMEKYAAALESPAVQSRIHPVSQDSFEFYRMDVSNAYGVEGVEASFLTKKIGDRYLTIIIMTDRDSHSSVFNKVLGSLQANSPEPD